MVDCIYVYDGQRGSDWGCMIIVMPMTFSIANGISIGILTYVAISLFAKKANEVHPVMYGLSVILVARFFWG